MKIYVITEMQSITWSIMCAFTSRKKADMQMNVIRNKICNGEWWNNANGEVSKGKIISEKLFSSNGDICRELCVETPKGLKIVYRMTPIPANCGYYE